MRSIHEGSSTKIPFLGGRYFEESSEGDDEVGWVTGAGHREWDRDG